MKSTHWICAWAVDDCACWVQTRDPRMAKELAKLDGSKKVARGVDGGYLATFELPYTLPWVQKNVVDRLTLKFPRENEGSKTGKASPASQTKQVAP